MFFKEIELSLKKKNINLIAGMDEAGRGPLAGPVVAACVILPDDFSLKGIKDSKKMTNKQRRLLFDKIKDAAIDFGIGVIDSKEIDSINILNATKKAMKNALFLMKKKPEYLLIDSVKDDWGIPSESLIKGEDKSLCIAAASILAKVHRDNLLIEYDKKYPEYDFKKHKGYGTIDHYIKIAMYGPSPIHRMSFEPLKSGTFSVDCYILEKELRKIRDIDSLNKIVEKIKLFKKRLSKEEINHLRGIYIKIEKRLSKYI